MDEPPPASEGSQLGTSKMRERSPALPTVDGPHLTALIRRHQHRSEVDRGAALFGRLPARFERPLDGIRIVYTSAAASRGFQGTTSSARPGDWALARGRAGSTGREHVARVA